MHPRTLKILLLLPILLGLVLGGVIGVKAEGSVQITSQVDYTFGEKITFQASVLSEIPIGQAMVLMQTGDQQHVEIGTATTTETGSLVLVYDLSQHPLQAFSKVTYWFDLVLQDGTKYQSDHFSFDYVDNRYNWEELDVETFRVHWYEGDISFAQEVINVAQAGLLRAQDFLPILSNQKIDIYVYDNAGRLQDTLLVSGQDWAAGHAALELGMILVSLPPGPEQHLEMERQVPHELMHLLLYQYTERGYKNLPVWLVEGLASINELYPNPEYQILLDNASEDGNLLKIDSLCQVFPREAAGVSLAYAESASFTGYLYQEFGSAGLENLVKQYANGVNCERGSELAIGDTLSQLEINWRADVFGENAYLSAIKGFLPWIVLLLVALLPLALMVFIR